MLIVSLKEDFAEVGKARAREIFKGCVIENSGQGGMAGIHEAIGRGDLPNAVAQIKIQEEMAGVEKLKEAIAKDLGTYGKKEVRTAVESGAAESILLISEKTKELEGLELLEIAQKNRTKVVEVSPHHHGGEMLIGLGGMAVILRYKLT